MTKTETWSSIRRGRRKSAQDLDVDTLFALSLTHAHAGNLISATRTALLTERLMRLEQDIAARRRRAELRAKLDAIDAAFAQRGNRVAAGST